MTHSRVAVFALPLCLLALAPSCRKATPPAGGVDAAAVPSAAATHTANATLPRGGKHLSAFTSDAEVKKFLGDWQEERRKKNLDRARRSAGAPQPPPAAAAPAEAEAKAESSEGAAADSVTNVQHAGVDEGGIVKVHGEYLVVLRRGRLFTVRIADGALTPGSSINAFGPDVSPSGAWYDEMLVSKGRVVVIGYSYQRGGTELGLFDIDGDGKLTYKSTYHLRSNDYYSSRNYASRLIGDKLIFYSPLYLRNFEQPFDSFPAMRRWRTNATPADFKRISPATRTYRPVLDSPSIALHTVSTCDLSAAELDCTATTVMGPPGRVFYVSPSSVYVWMTSWNYDSGGRAARSIVYRMPLDGGEPQALKVLGSPIDQMSFLEGSDEHLNVLVRADGSGDGMWGAEVTSGDMALLRVSLSWFGDGEDAAPRENYAALPKPTGWVAHNRFVGDYVLYGAGSGWGRPRLPVEPSLLAYRFAGGGEPQSIALEHGVDRIEALGRDAVVVGSDGADLHFSPVALGERAEKRPAYVRKNASQGETRSHGFFYKPDGDGTGLLGLPVVGGARPGYGQLTQGSASIVFLRNRALSFSELGTLDARPSAGMNDGCLASCVDWYGNARPLFVRGRVIALLGYELVEGQLDDGRLFEKRRASFAPTVAR